MDYADYLKGISFLFIQPHMARQEDGWYAIVRPDGRRVRLLEIPETLLDVANTRLPVREFDMKCRLRPLCKIPRMSTFAIGAMINRAVEQMCSDQVFVNVGVWHGFTFLSGIVGNPEKVCMGVDNFSQFDGPRAAFNERFEEMKGQNHRFYDIDYVEYFSRIHRDPIGVYVYDGEHSYYNQLKGLQIAEPFFAEDCIIIVDDSNWPEPRNATIDFMSTSVHEYRTLLDCTTASTRHPTLWNGIMILQRTTKKHASVRAAGQKKRDDPLVSQYRKENCAMAETAQQEKNEHVPPLVSVIIANKDGGAALRESIESALDQTYSGIEVIVVDNGSTDCSKAIIASYSDKIVAVSRVGEEQGSGFSEGVMASRGDIICLLESGDRLAPSTVEEGVQLGPQEASLHEAHARWSKWLQWTRREIMALIPPEEPFILVDEDQLRNGIMAGGRCFPFLERDGQYWGPPPDDVTAIRELERLRQTGALFMVFGWPAFWWLNHYSGLSEYLRSRFPCILENDRLIMFDLHSNSEK